MRRRWIFIGLAVASVVAGLIWVTYRQIALVRESRDKLRTIAALEVQLDAARQDLGEQRELLRGQTLTTTTRTPDEFLALFPANYPQGNWQPAESLFEDCWFRSADGLRLHGWLLHRERPKHAMLLMHGNAGNLTHRAALAHRLSERYAASVLIFDYRGYGRSEGTPTIPGLLLDARAARALLAEREGVATKEIVLVGESLGGAVAVDLAAEDGARALILQSTFSSLKEVAAMHYPAVLVDALVANRLDSAAKIKQYRGPLLQVHGDADRTIPFALGRKLFDAANEPKAFVALPGHDHNNPLPELYFQRLDEFMASLNGR
jgi:pimeloyl-ACP methyl ester carboxylesterase